ncbi:MAG: hypothetical protein R3B48_00090 [Kofleriaceae bacterium]
MRYLYLLGLGVALCGCSWLYDPSGLPSQANPDNLSVERVEPTLLLEGIGDDGGRPALLVIYGNDIASDATVTIEAKGGADPMLIVGTPRVDRLGRVLAVPVTSRVNPGLSGAETLVLDVAVRQPGSDGERVAHVDWSLQGFDELSAAPPNDGVAHIYSQVKLNGVTLPTTGGPVILRSNSSISIIGDVSVSALLQKGGPGGGDGGDMGEAGTGPGAGAVVAGLSGDGGGAGFAEPGGGGAVGGKPTGDQLITSYADNAGSGGGGAKLVSVTGATGGGGGGTLELTARGAVTIAGVAATGAAGGEAGTVKGGGGSGGVIVLRSGVMVSATSLDASGSRAAQANAGSNGRIRVDAPVIATTNEAPKAVRGAMFGPELAMVSDSEMLSFKLHGAEALTFNIHVLAASGALTQTASLADFQNDDVLDLTAKLKPGYNRICTTPVGSQVALVESTNCVEVAYLEPP